jgi:hypothetical protein
LACLAVGLGLLTAPASASAAVTLGSDLVGPFDPPTQCDPVGPPGCAGVQEALPGRPSTAPYDGVVVRWRALAVGPAALFVGRYTNDDTVLRTATSDFANPTSISTPEAFPTRLPITAGERVGIMIDDATQIVGRGGVTGTDTDFFESFPSTTTPTLADTTDGVVEVAYNADVEPDADGDGYGDETQDGCPTNAATQSPCPISPAPPAVPPAVVVQRQKITVTRRGVAPVRLSCVASPDSRCVGRVGLQMTLMKPIPHRHAGLPHRPGCQHPAAGDRRHAACRRVMSARHRRRRVNISLAHSARRFALPPGESTVGVRLSRPALARLESCSRLRVWIVVVTRDALGDPTIVKRRAVLVAPELDRTDEIPAPAATASLADMRAGRYSCGSTPRKPAA